MKNYPSYRRLRSDSRLSCKAVDIAQIKPVYGREYDYYIISV